MKDWNILNKESQIEQLIIDSNSKPILIFKHSTTCGISGSALHRVEGDFEALNSQFDLYYLDLLSYRAVSNAVARRFNVIHQSPQVIVLDKGRVVHHSSHYAIKPEKLLQLA